MEIKHYISISQKEIVKGSELKSHWEVKITFENVYIYQLISQKKIFILIRFIFIVYLPMEICGIYMVDG